MAWSSNERNIILIGKSGSGKSTLGNKILGWDGAFVTGDSSDPVTQDCRWESNDRTVDGTRLSLSVMDTPGLQDSNWSNRQIMQKIKNAAQSKNITAIIFVMKQGRMLDNDAMFTEILNLCRPQASCISALVLTNCEYEDKDRKVSEFRTNRRTQNIAAFMGLGIVAVGFPPSVYLQQSLSSNIQDDKLNVLRLISGMSAKYNANTIFQ